MPGMQGVMFLIFFWFSFDFGVLMGHRVRWREILRRNVRDREGLMEDCVVEVCRESKNTRRLEG